jgi:hypothetical protein
MGKTTLEGSCEKEKWVDLAQIRSSSSAYDDC